MFKANINSLEKKVSITNVRMNPRIIPYGLFLLSDTPPDRMIGKIGSIQGLTTTHRPSNRFSRMLVIIVLSVLLILVLCGIL